MRRRLTDHFTNEEGGNSRADLKREARPHYLRARFGLAAAESDAKCETMKVGFCKRSPVKWELIEELQ